MNVTPVSAGIRDEVVLTSAEKERLSKPLGVPANPYVARYKIEVIFSRHRSTLSHVASPLMLLIWESGKKLHGGGDQKMYWCGFKDCGKPMSSDNFGYMHVVCPHCGREMFLDPEGKSRHIEVSKEEGRSTSQLESMPIVVGEKMARLTPSKLADLLVNTFHQLGGDVDIYLKYSPFEIRYDPLHESTTDLDRLDRVRVQRKPLIYPLKNIIKDLSAGADLKKRFLGMITS
jgi:hypothetical protein